MFNLCPQCHNYHADKTVDNKNGYAICPECGYSIKFRPMPLFLITGASGTGKTTNCLELIRIMMDDIVVLDMDILWRDEFEKMQNGYHEYIAMWLRLCKNISLSGRAVALFGYVIPNLFEASIERRYFTKLHYLALICDDELLKQRFYNRRSLLDYPNKDKDLLSYLRFNHWLKKEREGETPIELVDTSYKTCQETAKEIANWIKKNIEC